VGVFGAGFRNYTEIYSFSNAYSPGVWAKGAHNSYLETWVELGIVGLVLLLIAIAGPFMAMRGIRRNSTAGVVLSAIEAGAIGVMAGAFFADRLVSKSFWLVWILLTWAIGNARDAHHSNEAS
jgi:O-antigen ligase